MIDLLRAESHEERADDRGDDADAADSERIGHHRASSIGVPAKKIDASTMVATVVTA